MAANNPKVSIVLPTYNRAKYLKLSIDSCLSQTFKDFELIIVDDCSKDETPQIVKSYTDPRIRYHRNDPNQRLPRSLNIGFSLAKGDYLTWTSDDNFFMPEALDKMVKCLEETKGDYVYTDIYSVQENDVAGAEHVKLPKCEEMSEHNCVRACFLYTRKVRDAVGDYDPDMELIEDYDYWVRCWQKFYLHHIPEPLYYYRYHSEALWSERAKENLINKFLFKLKYDFMSMDMVNWNLRNLRRKKLTGLTKYKRAIIDLVFYKGRIDQILKDYKAGKYTYGQTRDTLHKLINKIEDKS